MAYVKNALPELIEQYMLSKYQKAEKEAYPILIALIFDVKISTTAI